MRTLIIVGLCMLALILPGMALSATYYVNGATGSDLYDGQASVWDGIHGPKATIQAGIDVTAAGDVVIVAVGVYSGDGNINLSFGGKAITLKGADGPEETIVDCVGGTDIDPHRGVLFGLNDTGVLEGFTIRNAYAGNGAAVHCSAGCSPEVRNCILIDNEVSPYHGGAIWCSDGSEPTIEDCLIANNTAAVLGGGIFCRAASPTIRNCVLSNNTANGTATNHGGGAIGCDKASDLNVIDCVISKNKAYRGGGVYCVQTDSAVPHCTISGCEISDNEAIDSGGGICYWETSHVDIVDCVVRGNHAQWAGGGMAFIGKNLATSDSPYGSVRNCVISNNRTTGVSVNNCWGGGGVYIWNDGGQDTVTNPRLKLVNCLIDGNESTRDGGGILFRCWTNAHAVNCTIVNNTAANVGGGVCSKVDSAPVVENCIVWLNTAENEDGCAKSGNQIAVAVKRRPASEPKTDSMLTARYCAVQGGVPDILVESYAGYTCVLNYYNVMVSNPLFVSGPRHDLDPRLNDDNDYYLSHIAAGQPSDSPFINLGNGTAASLGLDTLTTRTDGVSDSGVVDLGYHAAYPFWIVDVYWDQIAQNVAVTFVSQTGVDYIIETADADAYSDTLTWSDWTSTTATGPSTTVMDNLTTRPLSAAFRFYRIKRQDNGCLSRDTAAVFEMEMQGVPSTRFISTPLIPDPDRNSTREVFGEGASAQIPRTSFQVSDYNEETDVTSRMRYDTAKVFQVLIGDEFDIEAGVGYEVLMGSGPSSSTYTLRLTGYVPETDVQVDMRTYTTESELWLGYSMPQPTTLEDLGLLEAVTLPLWDPDNRVRLLVPEAYGWMNYQYDTTGGFWYDIYYPETPANPDIQRGMGIKLYKYGEPDDDDTLILSKWYLFPPNLK